MTAYSLRTYVAYVRKALINAIGLAGALLAEGLVPKPYDHWVTVGIAVVTVVIHYAVPNGAAPGRTPAYDVPDEDDDAYVPSGPSDEDLADVAPLPAVPAPALAGGPAAPPDLQAALRVVIAHLLPPDEDIQPSAA